MTEVITFIEDHWTLFLVVSAMVGSYVWLKLDARYVKKDDIEKDIAGLKSGQAKIVERVDVVEQDVRHLPSAADVANLRVSLEQMKGDTKTLNATVTGLNRLVSLLLEREVKEE